jgi:hypothetical protein
MCNAFFQWIVIFMNITKSFCVKRGRKITWRKLEEMFTLNFSALSHFFFQCWFCYFKHFAFWPKMFLDAPCTHTNVSTLSELQGVKVPVFLQILFGMGVSEVASSCPRTLRWIHSVDFRVFWDCVPVTYLYLDHPSCTPILDLKSAQITQCPGMWTWCFSQWVGPSLLCCPKVFWEPMRQICGERWAVQMRGAKLQFLF